VLFQGKLFSLKVKKGVKLNTHVIISKSVYASAVKRNLLKRRVKSIIREFIGKKNTKLSIFIYTKKEVRDKNYKEIKEDIKVLLEKAKL